MRSQAHILGMVASAAAALAPESYERRIKDGRVGRYEGMRFVERADEHRAGFGELEFRTPRSTYEGRSKEESAARKAAAQAKRERKAARLARLARIPCT